MVFLTACDGSKVKKVKKIYRLILGLLTIIVSCVILEERFPVKCIYLFMSSAL